MIEGLITRGTTISGRSVNSGERVTTDIDTFRKLKRTGDIEEITEPESPVEESPKPAVPTKKKK